MGDAEPFRVLLAMEPRMYREAIAFSLRERRSDAVVVLASAAELSAEVARLAPHVVVANKVPGTPQRSEAYWVTVSLGGRMGAEIYADGDPRTVEELALRDLLELVDRADAQALGA